jgi:hypothetical protein
MAASTALFAAPYADISALPPCLENSFYGIFGEQALFKPTESDCVNIDNSFTVIPLPTGDEQLVWLQESAVDITLRTEEDYFLRQSEYQTVLFEGPISSVVHHDPTIVAVPDEAAAHALSTFLPRYWKAFPIPRTPVPFRTVPKHAVDHIRDLLETVHFDPVLASIVNGISVNLMRKHIRYLTNEDGTSGIESRHSFASGSRVAAAWLKEQFELTGATCELKTFLEGFAPNVIWYGVLHLSKPVYMLMRCLAANMSAR